MTWTEVGLAAVVVLPLLVVVGMILWPSPYADTSRDDEVKDHNMILGPADPMPTQPLPRQQWLR